MQPTLQTQRLLLRPFHLADAPRIQLLAGDYDVALNTAQIPHPYPDGAADAWIAQIALDAAAGKSVCFAICTGTPSELIGAIGLTLEPAHRRAELGYWLGKPYWNQGFATEAGREVVRWTFTSLELQRVYAHHYARNPASGRVLTKIGLQPEGIQRRHVLKWDEFLDVVLYGLIRSEYSSVE